jgi:hypothetical protein
MMSGSIARAASSKGMVPPLRSEFLLQIVGELDDPQQIGKTPKLEGLVLPGGGDWVLGREDGVAQLDIRMTLRTVENELIYVSCNGLLDMAPELRARLMQGESVDREEYYFRTSLVFETAAKNYGWLNRLVAVGVGTRTPEGMMTDVFAIR